MIADIVNALRNIGREYSGREIKNDDGTYTPLSLYCSRIADVLEEQIVKSYPERERLKEETPGN